MGREGGEKDLHGNFQDQLARYDQLQSLPWSGVRGRARGSNLDPRATAMAICRRQLRACAALLALVAAPAGALDNGLALTPPQGWRSWNSYTCQDSTNTTFTGVK